jgi:hypothetical protein
LISKQPHFLSKTAAVAVLLLLGLLQGPARAQTQPDSSGFDDASAARLLSQVSQGLEGRVSARMLGAFDLTRMPGGSAFKQQIANFINQTDSISVHFKLQETTGSTALVDVEMDATPHSDIAVPVRKHTPMRFTAEKGKTGWKFVDVQPRNFFSLQP